MPSKSANPLPKAAVVRRQVLSFSAALKSSAGYTKRHLLLGNGFSIACRPDIFVYKRLFEQADFSKLSSASRAAFDQLNTTDFERVIKALADAAKIAKVYGASEKVTGRLQRDSAQLKELLVQTIASSHPERPDEISDAEYAACQNFLRHFSTKYTLNYDWLLYWTEMHRETPAEINSDDGFRTSYGDVVSGDESNYVVWEPGQSHEQNMYFLHGALHIFDTGTEIQKYTWARTGIRLVEQTRQSLAQDKFPVFVAEGTSQEKLERIRHNDYLAKAYRSFQSIGGCLFIHGHSLAENDEHYLQMIERGKLQHVFVGLHGKPSPCFGQPAAGFLSGLRLVFVFRRSFLPSSHRFVASSFDASRFLATSGRISRNSASTSLAASRARAPIFQTTAPCPGASA